MTDHPLTNAGLHIISIKIRDLLTRLFCPRGPAHQQLPGCSDEYSASLFECWYGHWDRHYR